MRGEGWYEQRREMQYPEEKDLRGWRGVSVKEVLRFFEGEDTVETTDAPDQSKEMVKSLFDGFLIDLRARGIRVSTPEWMHFLTVVKERMKEEQLKTAVSVQEIFERLRVYARVTLVKNKQDETAFNLAFDQYFLSTAKVVENAVAEEEKKNESDSAEAEEAIEPQEEQEPEEEDDKEVEFEEPDIKEQLGIDEVDENLDLPDSEEHNDDEEVHGGKKDQHNDILRKQDKSKVGGGERKEEKDKEPKQKTESKDQSGGTGGKNEQPGTQEADEFQEVGILKGGGKGNSREATRVVVAGEEGLTREHAAERAARVVEHDRKGKYERRPERADIRQIVRNLRRIILDTSQIRGGRVDIRSTVDRFARRDFGIDYKREREKQPEIVLFIDVGGPVDEWSPLIREVAEEMTKGLTKLEVYLFHNNIYGYVWQPDPKDFQASSFAKPDSLMDVKSIVKRNKKVIIYGDAEMSATEFGQDQWPPRGNETRVEKFGMTGDDCLRWIEHRADSAVWVNPVFKKEWGERDGSGTIAAAKEIMPMHDLSVGGVQDAIKELMKK